MVDRRSARTGWRPRHGAGSPRPGTARSSSYEPHPAGAPGLVWDAPGRHANHRSTISGANRGFPPTGRVLREAPSERQLSHEEATMSDNKAILQRYYEQVFNGRDSTPSATTGPIREAGNGHARMHDVPRRIPGPAHLGRRADRRGRSRLRPLDDDGHARRRVQGHCADRAQRGDRLRRGLPLCRREDRRLLVPHERRRAGAPADRRAGRRGPSVSAGSERHLKAKGDPRCRRHPRRLPPRRSSSRATKGTSSTSTAATRSASRRTRPTPTLHRCSRGCPTIAVSARTGATSSRAGSRSRSRTGTRRRTRPATRITLRRGTRRGSSPGTEVVEFHPTAELAKTMEVVETNMAALAQ